MAIIEVGSEAVVSEEALLPGNKPTAMLRSRNEHHPPAAILTKYRSGSFVPAEEKF